MVTSRIGLILAGLWLVAASPARADSGRLHLHGDFGVGGAVTGASSFDSYGDERSVGGLLGLGLDWQFHPPIALEGQFQFGGFSAPFPNSRQSGASFAGVSFGVRLRLLDDPLGYPHQRGGNLKGNLWFATHFGWYSFDQAQYGFDASMGYDMSIRRPVSLGPFVRANLLFAGKTDGVDMVLVAGISTTFQLMDSSSSSDGDRDGVRDSEEERLGTNPRNRDTDGDGLPDGLEIDVGTDPRVGDSDGDGLADGFEDANANGRLDLEETDPSEFDTDGGGMSDGDEVFTYHTDPRDRRDDDTDGDGVANYADACPATPEGAAVDAAGCPTGQHRVAETLTVEFAAGRTRIAAAGEQALAGLAQSLSAGNGRVEIVLYVHPSGDAASDAQLAQRRADAISTWLAQHGVERTRYVLSAAGADPEAARSADASHVTLVLTRH